MRANFSIGYNYNSYGGGYSYPPAYGYGHSGCGYGDAYSGYGMDMQAQFAMQMQQMQWQQQQQLRQQALRGQQVKSAEMFHGSMCKGLGRIEDSVLKSKDLNREEFIDITNDQNALNKALAKYSADGILTSQERVELAQRRARLAEKLEHYRKTDSKPATNPQNAVARREAELLGKLYDKMKANEIGLEDAKEIRQQLSIASQQDGIDELTPQFADPAMALERREEVFSMLG